MKKYSDPLDYLYEIYPEKLHQCMIEITNFCNFHCGHCYNDTGSAFIFMSDELYDLILEELNTLGVKFLTLTGGEPFVHKNIKYFISKAREYKMYLKIMTNASMITDEAIQLLKTFPVQLSISLYGMKEQTYQKVTGISGMYEKVRNNISALLNKGIDFKLKFLLTKQSIEDLDLAYKFAEGLGKSISIDYSITPKNDGDCSTIRDHMLNESEIQKIIFDKEDYLPYRGEIDAEAYVCDAVRNKLYISPCGDVYPCVQYRETIGNIKNSNLNAIRKSAMNIASIKIKDLECNNCEYIRYCVPLCIGMNSVYGKSPFECDCEKMRMAKLKEQIHTQNIQV